MVRLSVQYVPRRGRWRSTASIALALVLTFASAPSASAATVSGAWGAKIGSGGVNGTATISMFTIGTGSIALKLAKLKPSTLLAVTVTKGTCTAATVTSVAAIKTTSAGAAARTSSLTAAQVNLIKAATKGTAKIAIRIGTGTTAKCGVFAPQSIPAYLAATLSIGGPYLGGLALSPSGLWVAGWYKGELVRVDTTTNSVLSRLRLGGTTENLAPGDLVYADGALWVAVDEYDPSGSTKIGESIRRIDPATGQSIATINAGTAITGVAASPGAIWVCSFTDGTLKRIDTATNQVTATVNLAPGPSGVAFGEGSIWVSGETSGTVWRVDPTTNQITASIATVGTAEGVVAGGGAIWVSNWGTDGQPDGVLSRLDPATNQVVQTIPVGTNPGWLAYGGGSVWVSLYGEATVVRVDATTKAVQKISTGILTLDKDAKPVGLRWITAGDHAVWVVQNLPSPDGNTLPPDARLFRVNF